MGKLTATHTYVELEISPAAYNEIKKKLEDAGYSHALMHDGTIDMFGIGLTKSVQVPAPPPPTPILKAGMPRLVGEIED